MQRGSPQPFLDRVLDQHGDVVPERIPGERELLLVHGLLNTRRRFIGKLLGQSHNDLLDGAVFLFSIHTFSLCLQPGRVKRGGRLRPDCRPTLRNHPERRPEVEDCPGRRLPRFLGRFEMTDAPTQTAEERLLDFLLEQERSIQFDSFGFADAWAVGSLLVELGLEREHPIAIAIMFGDQRVFHASLPGASADNDGWLENKFRVVRRFASSSLAVGTRFRAAGRDFDTSSRLDPRTHAAHGGAFPLRVRGALMGVVGVSGLAQQLDHDLVVEALRAHLVTRG